MDPGLQAPYLAGSWSRLWDQTAPASAQASTPPTPQGDTLFIIEGPRPLPTATGTPLPGSYRVGTAPASVTRDDSRGELIVQWTNPRTHHGAQVTARTTSTRFTLTVAELLRIAASLPAGS